MLADEELSFVEWIENRRRERQRLPGWSKQYDAITDPYLPEYVLKVQDEIPNDVARKLPLKLSDAEKQRLTRRYTQNAEAFDAYLKGRACWMKANARGLQEKYGVLPAGD